METCNNIFNRNFVQNLLDPAITGIIFVRLGNINPNIQHELIETFRDMKQTFIWEHDQVEINLPSNVIVQKHWPSKLILSHKNTILFITRDETVAVKNEFHSGVPMHIAYSKLPVSTPMRISIRIDEISRENLGQKLQSILSNHHNSVKVTNIFAKQLSNNQLGYQESRQLSSTNLHLDALGALIFVIFIIVKVSLKFCQFYNSWKYCQFSNIGLKKAKCSKINLKM